MDTTHVRRKAGRTRVLAVASVAMVAVMAGACTAPGQITLRGPWTIPLPTVDTRGPATTVPVIPGVCNTVYTPEGIRLADAHLAQR